MNKTLLLCFIVLLPYNILSQETILGKIYCESSMVEYIKVKNISQGMIVFSNINGDFKIKASIGDSISFSSSFYEKKSIQLNEEHFNKIIVIQLKEKVYKLKEVLIHNESKFKIFNIDTFNIEFNKQIKEDMIRNPGMYGYTNKNVIFEFLSNLFNKNKKSTIKFITSNEFIILFKKSELFNSSLLLNDLKIPTQYTYLFFIFCEEKKIKHEYLMPDFHLLLLNEMFSIANEFMELIRNEKFQ